MLTRHLSVNPDVIILERYTLLIIIYNLFGQKRRVITSFLLGDLLEQTIKHIILYHGYIQIYSKK